MNEPTSETPDAPIKRVYDRPKKSLIRGNGLFCLSRANAETLRRMGTEITTSEMLKDARGGFLISQQAALTMLGRVQARFQSGKRVSDETLFKGASAVATLVRALTEVSKTMAERAGQDSPSIPVAAKGITYNMQQNVFGQPPFPHPNSAIVEIAPSPAPEAKAQ